jgi:hypothetical protein
MNEPLRSSPQHMSKPPPTNSGILNGVGSLIDEHLALVTDQELFWKTGKRPPHYHNKSISKLFPSIPSSAAIASLAPAIFRRIARNFYTHEGARTRLSKENWRSTPQTRFDRSTTSEEKKLEKQWVLHQPAASWANQVPVASGFTGPHADSKRAIDLCWADGTTATFVELKVDSDNPLYAAFEILNYGLLYIFARRFLKAHYGTCSLMKMKTILLTVLAPANFYKDFPTNVQHWLESTINDAVLRLAVEESQGELKMGFCFSVLPSDNWKEEALASVISGVQDDFRAKLALLSA